MYKSDKTPRKGEPTPKRVKSPIQGIRNKQDNTKAFNKKAKKRRNKARHDELNRKKNRKCGFRG